MLAAMSPGRRAFAWPGGLPLAAACAELLGGRRLADGSLRNANLLVSLLPHLGGRVHNEGR